MSRIRIGWGLGVVMIAWALGPPGQASATPFEVPPMAPPPQFELPPGPPALPPVTAPPVTAPPIAGLPPQFDPPPSAPPVDFGPPPDLPLPPAFTLPPRMAPPAVVASAFGKSHNAPDVVPEPATGLLVALGLGGLAIARRRG